MFHDIEIGKTCLESLIQHLILEILGYKYFQVKKCIDNIKRTEQQNLVFKILLSCLFCKTTL